MQVAGNDLLLEPTVAQKSFLSVATLDLIEQKKVAYLRLLDWRRSGGKDQRPQQSHRCSLEWSRKKEQGHKNPSKERGHKNPQQIYREILNATRKSVKEDHRAHWKNLSERLELDFKNWKIV